MGFGIAVGKAGETKRSVLILHSQNSQQNPVAIKSFRVYPLCRMRACSKLCKSSAYARFTFSFFSKHWPNGTKYFTYRQRCPLALEFFTYSSEHRRCRYGILAENRRRWTKKNWNWSIRTLTVLRPRVLKRNNCSRVLLVQRHQWIKKTRP